MKFYNIGHKTSETDFKFKGIKSLDVTIELLLSYFILCQQNANTAILIHRTRINYAFTKFRLVFVVTRFLERS